MSSALAKDGKRHSWKVTAGILLVGIVAAMLQGAFLPAARDFALFKGTAAAIDSYLGAFTATNGASSKA